MHNAGIQLFEWIRTVLTLCQHPGLNRVNAWNSTRDSLKRKTVAHFLQTACGPTDVVAIYKSLLSASLLQLRFLQGSNVPSRELPAVLLSELGRPASTPAAKRNIHTASSTVARKTHFLQQGRKDMCLYMRTGSLQQFPQMSKFATSPSAAIELTSPIVERQRLLCGCQK